MEIINMRKTKAMKILDMLKYKKKRKIDSKKR